MYSKIDKIIEKKLKPLLKYLQSGLPLETFFPVTDRLKDTLDGILWIADT